MTRAGGEHLGRAADWCEPGPSERSWKMTTIESPELSRDLASGSGILVGRQASGRDRFEALGLLVGILGVLLVVAMTVGAGPPA
jgi:hypothetical protein